MAYLCKCDNLGEMVEFVRYKGWNGIWKKDVSS